MGTAQNELITDDEDLQWCHETVGDVSRTFAITIDVLDEPMASYICIGYLLCRVADTIEDAPHLPPAEQAALLRTYDRVLDPDDDVDAAAFLADVDPWMPEGAERVADWTVVDEVSRVVDVFERQPVRIRRAIRPPVRELVRGMAVFVDRYADAGGLRIQTVAELEEYCHYAAGTVGELITNLVCVPDLSDARTRRLYRTAESFGLLLQLVNVAKDVHDDLRTENNVYLPASWLREEGISPGSLCDESSVEGAAAVVRRTADHARTFVDDAQRYLEDVPQTNGNRLAAWAIPFLLAVGTLRELSARPEDALTGRGVKVSRREVAAVVAAVIDERDPEAIGELRRIIAQRPYHAA